MVDPQRTKYVGGSEGAPPLPPAGGYQGARRTGEGLDAAAGLVSASDADVTYTLGEAGEKKTTNTLGLIAICVSVLFIVALLLLMGAGGTDTLLGPTMLVVQFLVIGGIAAAMMTRRGRMLGSIALSLTLAFNVATVGAMGALRTAATHAYDGTKSEEQKHAEAYPGVKGTSASDALNGPSLEQVQNLGDELMAEARQRITERFGYEWVQAGAVDISPERNGYGGESMLKRYMSATWTTTEPVQDNTRKRQIMAVIDDVLAERGMYTLYPLNEADAGISADMIAKLYGSAEPERQHTWEYYTSTYPDPLRFYALALDLSKDPTGDFRTEREAIRAQTGEPLEGIQLVVIARQVLPEADRAEFEQRLRDYPGF